MTVVSSILTGLKRVFLTEPTLLNEAVRATGVLAVAFGADLTDVQLGALVVAYGAWAAVANRALVVPAAAVQAKVDDALAMGVEVGRIQQDEALRQYARDRRQGK